MILPEGNDPKEVPPVGDIVHDCPVPSLDTYYTYCIYCNELTK